MWVYCKCIGVVGVRKNLCDCINSCLISRGGFGDSIFPTDANATKTKFNLNYYNLSLRICLRIIRMKKKNH